MPAQLRDRVRDAGGILCLSVKDALSAYGQERLHVGSDSDRRFRERLRRDRLGWGVSPHYWSAGGDTRRPGLLLYSIETAPGAALHEALVQAGVDWRNDALDKSADQRLAIDRPSPESLAVARAIDELIERRFSPDKAGLPAQ